MDLNNRIKAFESNSYQKKIDFIDNYDYLKQECYDLFYQIIIKTEMPVNYWYMIRLVELSSLLGIKNKGLLNKYLKLLVTPNIYYLKLTVLDYIIDTYDMYKEDDIDYSPIEVILHTKRDRLITKNQALVNLIFIYPSKKTEYLELLKLNLKKTKDYRSHIRVYNNLLNVEIRNKLTILDIGELLKISKSINLGYAVSESIKKLEQVLT